MAGFATARDAIAWLLTPQAIRQRCGELYALAEADRLQHFALDLARLDATADYVIATIKAQYPDLAIPYHSRWRHFAAGGRDRWAGLAQGLKGLSRAEIARIRTELAIVSVLLDAGAGVRWAYTEPDGARYTRSEGLALASFDLYAQGLLSSQKNNPYCIDAAALTGLDEADLARAFQASAANPLVGSAGRAALLRRLGGAIQQQPELFSAQARLGHLYDYFARQADNGKLPAAMILQTLLTSLSAIWPSRIAIDGVNLGDVWRHSKLRTPDLTDGLVPFHKLSQWLSYSLLEPLHEAGLQITDVDALTGLPEYRNGGLFIDLGVLRPKHNDVLGAEHTVDSEVVVEWRALTVSLLDKLAERVRSKLGLDSSALPLAKVLEGGTWSAGRRSARDRRPDGAPPLTIISDGTVF